MLNLFEIEPENIYGLAINTENKEQKIMQRIESDEYIASVKKDGNYARFVKYDNNLKIQTRGISVVTNTYGEIQEKIPHIAEFLNKIIPENSLIIGEVYRPEMKDKDVGSVLRCLAPKAIKRQEGKPLYFYIHDIWSYNGEELLTKTKMERVEFLRKLEKEWGELPEYIEFAEFVEGVDKIKELLEEVMDNGEEGIVLTLKHSIVTPGKRPAWKTLKIKKELTNEADVFLTGNFKEPTKEYTGKDIQNWEYWLNDKTSEVIFGKHYRDYLDGATITPITKPYYKGWFGSLEIAVLNENNERVIIGYVSGISDDIKEDFAQNPNKYIDKVCVVNAMETTADYKLRHPKFVKFRDDISIESCTFKKIFEVKGE